MKAVDGRALRYALFDTRPVYDVVMLVVIEGESDGARLPGVILPSVPPVRPCYGRVTRSDVAELNGGRLVQVRASVGVAWSAGSNVSVDALVAASDDAMYESKRHGDIRPILAPPLAGSSALVG